MRHTLSTGADPDHVLPCRERSCDIVGVFLVDPRGWVLLQERDEHAPVAAGQWRIVGGHVNPGESREDAMRRELREQTGLLLPDGVLELWYVGLQTPETKATPHLRNHWQLWVGGVDLTDDDVVCEKGRRIVFVDPERIGDLELAPSTAYFLPALLQSPTYGRLHG